MKIGLRFIGVVLVVVAGCRGGTRVVDAPRRFPGVAEQDVTFYSVALARKMTYRVYLPLNRGLGKLPAVYLLHGGGGDYRDWSLYSNVGQYAAQGFAVVMPEGKLSYWINAALTPRERYGDYLTNDLIQDVEQRFPVLTNRSGRAVIGISMGGYAAVKLALTRPELFSFAGAISPAVHVPTMRFNWRRFWQSVRLRHVFGPDGSPSRREADVLQEAISADPAMTPYLYITAGERNPMRDQIRHLVQILEKRGFASEFHIMPGGHDWNEWNAQIPGCFGKLMDVMSDERPRPDK